MRIKQEKILDVGCGTAIPMKMYNSDYNSLRRFKIKTKYIDNMSLKFQIILIKTRECG